MSTISAQDFCLQRSGASCTVLDVRSPNEFALQNIPGSINLPLDQIERGQFGNLAKNQPIYLICQSGVRSQRAQKILSAQGYSVICVKDGLMACSAIPGIVTTYSRTLPLMRQVQLVAGLLIVTGVLLSLILHPAWIGLSLFVGVGLTVAGATGFCGMAILLEKMPWNQIHSSKNSP